MTDWIVGDIHGCARELEALLGMLRLSASDRLISVGDLFHRGPDPVGVMEILEAHRAQFVLGNHEHLVLSRFGLAPRRADGSDRPALREVPAPLEDVDLRGDGGQACCVPPERRADVLRFLQKHSGYYLVSEDGGRPTLDGRPWCALHAGLEPGVRLEDSSIRTLTRLRRLDSPGRPWWYEAWRGPRLVLFGHTPSPLPRAWRVGGQLVALGLDTGCVYGGRLTAYAPELDELVAARATRAYAAA